MFDKVYKPRIDFYFAKKIIYTYNNGGRKIK